LGKIAAKDPDCDSARHRQTKGNAMSEIEELHRRLNAAFDRIEAAVDARPAEAGVGQPDHSRLTRMVEEKSREVERLRNTIAELSETLGALRTAQADRLADPDLVNHAMLAELAALRAIRLTEIAQMDEILAELHPLIQEAQDA
jgi:hypothetical protein